MPEWLKLILVFFCGSGGLALIDFAKERWKFRADRIAKKEDKQEEKKEKLEERENDIEKLTALVEELTKQQEETNRQLKTLQEAQKCVLLDRIIHLGQSFIADGEIDFDDRRRLREMHDSYHNGLGGNGDANAIMKAVDQLPLKNHS